MPREKIELKRIENRASLQVTFSKRRKGLFKKAKELAIMCDAQVGVVVFSAANKLTHFANPGIDEIIERWNTHFDTIQAQENPPLDLQIEEEYERLSKQYYEEELMVSQMEGKELGNLSMEELNELEDMMQNSLSLLKAKQTHPMEEKDLLKQEVEVQNETDEERTLPDSVLATPVNQTEGIDDDLHSLSLRLGYDWTDSES